MTAKPPARMKPAQPASAEAATSRPVVPMLIGALGFVMLAVVIGWMLVADGGGGVDSVESAGARVALEQAGCSLSVVEAQANESDHSDVPTPDTKVAWNTFPPTNGPHYGVPIVFGAYDEPLQQAPLVHNLEHGGVYIQYGEDVPAATVSKLRDFYEEHLNGTVLAPLPELGTTVALGAWVGPDGTGGADDRGLGYLAKCTDFDEPAYAAFFDAFQFKGPEHFPESALAPGS